MNLTEENVNGWAKLIKEVLPEDNTTVDTMYSQIVITGSNRRTLSNFRTLEKEVQDRYDKSIQFFLYTDDDIVFELDIMNEDGPIVELKDTNLKNLYQQANSFRMYQTITRLQPVFKIKK